MKFRHYVRHHHVPNYEITIARHLVSISLALGIVLSLVALLVHFAHPQNAVDLSRLSSRDIAVATVNTFSRMLIAFLPSLVISIPLALLIASSPRTQSTLLPVADVLQSIPVLAFFPAVATFFVARHAFELAAIFVILIQMIWNIVFPVVGGLQTIPDDIQSAALVFNVRGPRKLWFIILPALFPFIVTGSLLAWAQGWTIVIVAEVLHTYLPNGNASQDLLGLGSLLVDSNAKGNNGVFLAALVAMILVISLLNLMVWQPLLRLSQRFRFD